MKGRKVNFKNRGKKKKQKKNPLKHSSVFGKSGT